ncbi:4-hydroxy-tetrahydrodipicolinate reductase [Phycisphaerae bacterium RAS1]|nr:4-hydroxy-tetrahydrodipicolinate reductase [Phycisphaerae bacterium RAS1]
MTPVRVAIAGCTGRMGRALVRLASADAGLRVVGAVTIESDALLGTDASVAAGGEALGVAISASLAAPADVVIEFTTPAGCRAWAEWCAARGVALVSGTTGLSDADRAAMADAARRCPLLWAANMSVGVNLLLALVKQAAARLDESWDIEISEAHHRHKADAPSGTAKALLEAVCEGRQRRAADVARFGRGPDSGKRGAGEIGLHALRLGEIVGDHDVHFCAGGELLTLSHRALSRDTFAAGALRAAKWLAGRPAGAYSMRDVLGL